MTARSNGMYTIKEMSNGLTVVTEQLPFVRSIAFGIWIGNGSVFENKKNNGISHFIEHMLFKGTNKRSAKGIAEEMDCIGGHINAFTSKEYTCFYTITLDEHFEQALEIMSDMLLNSKFSAEEIEREKGVIQEEINMYEDSPEDLVYDLFQYNIWKGHPIGLPILGFKDTVSAFQRKDVINFYSEHYAANNIILSLAGNFENEKIYTLIEKYFGGWGRKTKYSYAEIPDIQYKPSFIGKEKKIEQVHAHLGFPGLPAGHEDAYTMTVINTIFGGGMSSRLFQKIREEKGLTYSIYSYTSAYKKMGLFSIYAAMNPSQTMEVLQAIQLEIQELLDKGIKESELNKTKEQIKSNYIIGLESTSSRMSTLGKSKLLLDHIRTPDEIIEKVDAVSADQVDTLIKKIFDFSSISVSVVGKIKKLKMERIQNVWKV